MTLARSAANGDPVDQHALAGWFYANGDEAAALAWLGRAAKAGRVPAIIELGGRMATGLGAPAAPADGVRLLEFAAGAGSAEATRLLATLHAAGVGVAASLAAAWRLLGAARSAGDPDAAQQMLLVRLMTGADPNGWSEADWREWIDAMPRPAAISDQPRIGTVAGFASPELCAHLIAIAAPRIEPAGVIDRRSGLFGMDPSRTNGSAQVKLFDMSLPLLLLRARMIQLLDVAPSQCEPMNVLHYRPGQRFAPHHDYLDPTAPSFAAEIGRDGQRIATFLVYLNADYSGGETNFPLADISHRAAVGDALFFFNVGAEGEPDPMTLHEGCPTREGEKWVLSQWVRDRPIRSQ